MALSGKYGQVNVPGIPEDEPVFILRAQDVLAGPAIDLYRVLAASHNAGASKSLDREIASFRQWAGKKKLPD